MSRALLILYTVAFTLTLTRTEAPPGEHFLVKLQRQDQDQDQRIWVLQLGQVATSSNYFALVGGGHAYLCDGRGTGPEHCVEHPVAFVEALFRAGAGDPL